MKARFIVALGSMMLALAMVQTSPSFFLPAQGEGSGVGTKDNHDWNEQDRESFYHTSIGTQFIPYDWFLALRDYSLMDATGKPLQDYGSPLKDTVRHYGLIVDAPGPGNPDGLPVGMTKTVLTDPSHPDPEQKKALLTPARVGFNCAFCHTSEFMYDGKKLRIDGAASLQYNMRFLAAVLVSMKQILKEAPRPDNPKAGEKFIKFAINVLRSDSPVPEDQQCLAKELMDEVSRLSKLGRLDALEWGFGRLDALGRGGNSVFSKLAGNDSHDPLGFENIRHANAPVSIPAIWGVYDYTIVQWNGSIENRLARNIAQVIGVGADLFTDPKDHFSPSVDPQDPFRSSVHIEGLETVERLAEHLPQPTWPAIFPPIVPETAARGSKVYEQRCAHCHVPKQLSEPGANGGHQKPWMIPLDEIGTDPMTAVNFANRTAVTGDLRTVLGKKQIPERIPERMSAAPATEFITSEIMKRASKAGPNPWHAPLAYMARPHKAVWATPPFLHNGSIPNLHELLSPWESRSRCFEFGPSFEFDPLKVGLVTQPCELDKPAPQPLVPTNPFRFETIRTGNSNRGHEFRATDQTGRTFTEQDCEAFGNEKKNGKARKELEMRGLRIQGIIGCQLSDEDRKAVIEYLKTI